MMLNTIDELGFLDGTINEVVVNANNEHKVVREDLPELELTGFQRWRWVNGQWVATEDVRGHIWYSPLDPDQEHRPITFDDLPPSGWVYWSPGENKVYPSDLLTQQKWAEVRTVRNKLLADSDWVVTRAMESGTEVPAEWVTYRQLLRDVTTQADPFLIVWPLAPNSENATVFEVGAMQ